MAKIKVPIKHANEPSKLFLEPLNFLSPKFIPTIAANVSPIAKEAIATNVISTGKKAIQTTEATIK